MRLSDLTGLSLGLLTAGFRAARSNPWPTAVIVGWAGLLGYLALLPGTPRVPGVSPSNASAAGHFVTHAVLAALLYWIFSSGSKNDRRWLTRAAIIAVGASFGFGVVLEFVQAVFTNVRTFEYLDIVLDLSGAVSGTLLFLTLEIGGLNRRALSLMSVAAVALVAAGVITSVLIWNPRYPYVGDHWHFGYMVIVCGEIVSPFSGFEGDGLSSRGDRTVHLHPSNADEVGAKLNLGRLFSVVGGELSNSTVSLPSGETYVNGNDCPTGIPGELRLFDYDLRTRVRGERIDDVSTYAPRNGQMLLIEFWAPDDG